MPLIEVSLFEDRLTDETAAELITKLTDAMVECMSEEIRSGTWVVINGVAPKHWGFGGHTHA